MFTCDFQQQRTLKHRDVTAHHKLLSLQIHNGIGTELSILTFCIKTKEFSQYIFFTLILPMLLRFHIHYRYYDQYSPYKVWTVFTFQVSFVGVELSPKPKF